MDSMIGRPMTRDGAEFDQVESPVPEPPDLADSPSPRTEAEAPSTREAWALHVATFRAFGDDPGTHALGYARCQQLGRELALLGFEVRAAQEAPAPEGLARFRQRVLDIDNTQPEHRGRWTNTDVQDALAALTLAARQDEPSPALPEAAQEAPAPDGLRAAIERVREYMDAAWDDGRWTYEGLARAALSAFPSPAEPPRPDHQHHYEHDFRCGTCGATFLAVLTDDRAEARPPKGLPWLVARGQDEPPTRLLPALLERIANRAHQGWLSENVEAEFRTIEAEARLAARLSARGAEPR